MANRIKEHRERRGLSQPALAKLIGSTPQTVSKLETGVQRVNDQWLRLIASALSVPQAALLDEGTVGVLPGDSDIVQTDLERLILRFWRNLPPGRQDAVVTMMAQWAGERVSRMAQPQPQPVAPPQVQAR